MKAVELREEECAIAVVLGDKQTHNRCLGKHAHGCRQTSQDTQTHTHIVYSLSLSPSLSRGLSLTLTLSLSLSLSLAHSREGFFLPLQHTHNGLCAGVLCV